MSDRDEGVRDVFSLAAPDVCTNCKNKIEGSAFYPRVKRADGQIAPEQDVTVYNCMAHAVVAGAEEKKAFAYEGRVLYPMSMKPLCAEVVRTAEEGGGCAHFGKKLSTKIRHVMDYIPLRLEL